MKNLSYPFWSLKNRSEHCGSGEEFHLLCEAHNYPTRANLEQFWLFYVDQSAKAMSSIRKDVWNIACPGHFANDSFVKGSFDNEYNWLGKEAPVFLRLYSDCNRNSIEVSDLNRFPCPRRGEEGSDAFYSTKELGQACNFRGGGFWVPGEAISLSRYYGDLESPFCSPCEASHGICGTNESTNRFACLCIDGPREFLCQVHGSAKNTRNKLILGVICGVAITNFCVILLCLRKKLSSISSMIDYKNATESNRNVESFLQNHGAMSLKRYNFSDVNKITNSFKDRIGQGGYGSVYRGKLRDDCLVAVKVLSISKGNGEEFINEVASISRTPHINIVNLLGFCVEDTREFSSTNSCQMDLLTSSSAQEP